MGEYGTTWNELHHYQLPVIKFQWSSQIEASPPMLFLGTYEYTMDDRGRIPIPSAFREAFAAGAILSPAPPRCMRVYTTEAYERAAALILRAGAHTEKGQQLRRAFFGRTYEGELDRVGRLLIPVALRQRQRFNGAVTLVGCGDYLELWDTAACGPEMANSLNAYESHYAALDDDA